MTFSNSFHIASLRSPEICRNSFRKFGFDGTGAISKHCEESLEGTSESFFRLFGIVKKRALWRTMKEFLGHLKGSDVVVREPSWRWKPSSRVIIYATTKWHSYHSPKKSRGQDHTYPYLGHETFCFLGKTPVAWSKKLLENRFPPLLLELALRVEPRDRLLTKLLERWTPKNPLIAHRRVVIMAIPKKVPIRFMEHCWIYQRLQDTNRSTKSCSITTYQQPYWRGLQGVELNQLFFLMFLAAGRISPFAQMTFWLSSDKRPQVTGQMRRTRSPDSQSWLGSSFFRGGCSKPFFESNGPKQSKGIQTKSSCVVFSHLWRSNLGWKMSKILIWRSLSLWTTPQTSLCPVPASLQLCCNWLQEDLLAEKGWMERYECG